MSDNISKLYGALKDTYELGSEDEFRKYLSDGKKREALRKELEADYEVGDSAAFTKYLGLDAQPQKPRAPYKPTWQEQMAMDMSMGQAKHIAKNATAGFDKRAKNIKEYQQKKGKQPIKLGKVANVVETDNGYLTETGDQFDLLSDANQAQGAINESRREKPVDEQLQNAFAERERLNKEMGNVKGEWIDADGRVHYGNRGNDEAMRALQAAYQQNEERIKTLTYEKDNAGFWEHTGKELGDLNSWNPFNAVENTSALLRTKQKVDAGQPLDKSDSLLLANTLLNQEAHSKYDKNRNAWFRAGGIAAESIKLMPDFMMGMGPMKGIASGVAKGTGKLVTKAIGKAAAEKVAGKVLTKVAGIGVGALAGGAAMVNTIQAPRLASETMSNMTGNLTLDEQGNYKFEGADSFLGAVLGAEQKLIPEAASEVTGEFLPGAGKVLEGLGLKKIAGGLSRLQGTNWYKNYSRALEHAGFHGAPGEALEEYIGDVYSAVLGDISGIAGDENGKGGWGDPDKHVDILLGTATLGALLHTPSAANAGKHGAQYYYYRHNVNKADKAGRDMMGEDTWDALKGALDNTTNENVSDVLKQMLGDNRLSPEEKKTVLDYGVNLQKQRGHLLAIMAENKEEKDEPAKAAEVIDNSFAAGYEASTPEEKQAISENASLADQNLNAIGEGFASWVKDESNPPMAVLAYMMGHRDTYTDEQIAAAADYYQTKSAADGMQQAEADQADLEGASASRPLYTMMDKQDGKLVVNSFDKNGNLLGKKAFDTEDDARSYQSEVMMQKQHQDFTDLYNSPKMNPETVAEIEAEQGLEAGTIDNLLNTDPMRMTDAQWSMLGDAMKSMQEKVYPATEVHTDFSKQVGMEAADDAAIDTDAPNTEAVSAVVAPYIDARNNLLSLFSQNEELAEEVQLYEQMGKSEQEIISSLDSFPREQVQTVIDFYNAQASFDGFMNRSQEKIEERVKMERGRRTFKGTINGEPNQLGLIEITDGTDTYTLVNGAIETNEDGVITDSESGMILALDQNGNIVSLDDTTTLSVLPSETTLDVWEQTFREQMQENATAAIDPDGSLMQQPNEEQGGVAEGEASVVEGTGANEPLAPATVAPETPQEQQPAVTIESITGEDGVKRYENGISVDDAIEDMQADGLNVAEEADLAISEAKAELAKIKQPKTRAERVKLGQKQKELQGTIDYYNKVKERWEEKNNPVVPTVMPTSKVGTKKVTADEQKQQRIVEAKAKYGEHFDDDFNKANDVYELVSMWVGRKRNLAWDDVNGKRGLQKELGWTRKIGGDTKYIETLLAKNGEGVGVDEFAHMVWESPENDVMGEKRWSTEEIKEALLDLVKGAQSKSDVIDHALNSRIAQAEAAMQQEQQYAEEQAAEHQNEPIEEQPIVDGGLPFGDATEEDFTNDVNEPIINENNDVPLHPQQEPTAPLRKVVATAEQQDHFVSTVLPLGEYDKAKIEGRSNDEVYPALINDLEEYLKNEGVTIDDMELPEDIKDIIKRELYGEEKVPVQLGQAEKEATAEAGAEPAAEPAERAEVDENDPYGIGARLTENEDTREVDTPDGTRIEQDLLIDGKHKVVKIDEPNSKGDYTGSRYEFEGKSYGDLIDVVKKIDSKSEQTTEDDYLNPRNAEEEKIISDVLNKLQQEIQTATEEENAARAELNNARAKESDRATDMFANDEAFAEPDAIFSQEEMGLDTSAEGVNKRTKAQQEKLQEAINKVNQLHSPAERKSRIRGALDNHRKQTSFATEEKPAARKWEYNLHYDKQTGRAWIDRDDVSGLIPIGDGRWHLEGKSLAELRAILENPKNNLGEVYDAVEASLHNAEVGEQIRKGSNPIEAIDNAAEQFHSEKEDLINKRKERWQGKKDSDYGKNNKLVSQDRYEELKKRMQAKLHGQLNAGFDPEILSIGTEMAMFHIEAGARKFADFSKRMIADLGDSIRPYLKAIYNGARNMPGMEELRNEMSSYESVELFDMLNFDKTGDKSVNEHKQKAGDTKNVVPSQEDTSVEVGRKAEDADKYRAFSQAVADDMLAAMESGEKPYKSIKDIRSKAKSLGLDVDDAGRTDILLQELVEDGLVGAARQYVNVYVIQQMMAGKKPQDIRESRDLFNDIVKLYALQPSITQRSSNRIKMQQYSTPLPMSFVADVFAFQEGMKDVLEPTAGNGMMVFAVPELFVHANELDPTRLDNLKAQKFKKVTDQDATKPFEGEEQYDSIIANPPFGAAEAKEYDGKMIPGLAEQIALNALSKMKDNGRAAIIIGGNMEYAPNGAIKSQKPFFTYLYNHYNVKGVIDMEGKLYQKQGTTFPTRMILIEGRRSDEERAMSTVYPPTKEKALKKATTFEELFDIAEEIRNNNNKTNGTEILRTPTGIELPDNNNASGNVDRSGHNNEPRQNESDGGRTGRRGSDRGNESATSHETQSAGERRSVGTQQPRNAGLSDTQKDSVKPQAASRTNREGGSNGNNGESRPSNVQGNGTVNNGVGLTTQPVTPKVEEKRELNTDKLSYRPHNTAFSLQSVAPAAMVEAMDNMLKKIEKEHGNVDHFVTTELGYDTTEEMHKALAAEQVDSVAMAIYQMKHGQAMIIGDQTGVGKGRQMAALIRWACKQGKKPVFITQKADLFSDIYRDLVDVGSGELRPFIFNSDGAMVDNNGVVVHKPLSAKTQAQVFAGNELPEGYDFAVLTYSQVNTGDSISQTEAGNAAKERGDRGTKKSKRVKAGKATPKATFLRAIVKDSYMFLDESHTAAGKSNTGAYFQSIIKTAKAVTFASATFAKRPDTMPMYALRTAMSKAKVKSEDLIHIIENGGVTLQEIMSRALTKAGQMVRRERDMSDVKTDWKTVDDPATVKKARDNYDKTIEAFNAIINFQKDYVGPQLANLSAQLADVASSADFRQGTEDLGIKNVPFASKTYNYTKQLMLALKTDAIVDEVVKEIEAGRHPVIALENTMGSLLSEYAPGDTITETTFAASLLKGLEGVLRYTITDENGDKKQMTLSPKQLGEDGEFAYHQVEDLIRESTSGIFISPLDAIIEKLQQKGYKVGELTGRNECAVLDENTGEYKVQKRTDKDKKKLARDFNSGALDVLILNKSASTGISLHASEKFSDQRQRTMIIAQPLADINDYMQMIGRIDRTGQVERGYYINLGLPVPAEGRFLMMLSTKLKSLNANTTTSQENESNDVEAPDLLNKYGSKVIIEYLRDNPDIYEKMGEPLKEGGAGGAKVTVDKLDEYAAQEDDARKITGYVALLPTEEQDAFYNDVVRRYNELIKYLNDTGSNDLKISVLPLRTRTIEKQISSEGTDPNGDNPFAGHAYVEWVEMDVLKKPMKAAEVGKVIEQLNPEVDAPMVSAKTASEEKVLANKLTPRVRQLIHIVESESDAKLAKEEERYKNAKKRAEEDIAAKAETINKQEKRTEEQKAEAIDKYASDRRQSVEEQHNNNVNKIDANKSRMLRYLKLFGVGDSVLVPDDLTTDTFMGASNGIFCGFKAKDEGITPSTTLAVFCTLDGRRKLEIKLSDWQSLTRIDNMTQQNWDSAYSVTLTNWDNMVPKESRKQGFIMTGNILQAFADAGKDGRIPGQLVTYTDIDGEVHDGILMNQHWSPSQLKGSTVPLKSRMEQILNLENGENITSADNNVVITRWYSYYTLSVPKSKKLGAQYYENGDLLDYVDNGNFYPNRGTLTADVDPTKIREVVEILSNLGVSVQSENKVHFDNETEMGQAKAAGRRFDEDTKADVAKPQTEHSKHIAEHVDKLVEKLGTKSITTAYHSLSEVPEDIRKHIKEQHKVGKKVRGWYENGKVYLYLPDIDSAYQAEKTIWHETVAHHGLRELIGAENYDKLLKQLWLTHKDGDMGEWVSERMAKNGWKLNEAIDEYLAREAEKDSFKDPSLWQRLKWMLANVLHKLGFTTEPTLSDVKYLFWVSQNLLRKGDAMSNIKQMAFLHKLERAAAKAPYVNMNASNVEDIYNPNAEDAYDDGTRYREETDEEVIDRLEKEPKIKTYRAMVQIDGKLYPPMSTKIGGKLRNPSVLGKWERSEEAPEKAKEKNGKYYFTLNKDSGSPVRDVAYNPYIHSSTTMLNDQFKGAEERPNLVVVEMEVPASELTSGYHADKAHLPVGKHPWNAGSIQKYLTGTREVVLSRWAKPVRIVPTEEYADHVANMVKGQVDVFPSAIVTPEQRKALEARGIKFVNTDGNLKLREGANKGKVYNYGERRFDEDIDDPMEYSAKKVYDERLNTVKTIFSEAYQDAMVSLKTAQNAIAGDNAIPDSQNAYMAENLMHGKNKNEQDLFNAKFRDPLNNTIKKIMNLTGMSWGDVDRYVYTKSGLERNREFFVRDWLNEQRKRKIDSFEDLNEAEQEIYTDMANTIETMFEDGDIESEAEKNKKLTQALYRAHKQFVDEAESGYQRVKTMRYMDLKYGLITFPEYLAAIDSYINREIDEFNPDEHDYSGFRAMFGTDYSEVDIINELMNTEDMIEAENVNVLWSQINAATEYGLERYREAGMRSDEQIDRVKQMFHWYVPMRGFKENRGEDMYQYFTDKGSTKSYVGGLLKHAKGRGSEANYPISTIFAMSYKAIADCNQNMVCQKLYRLCEANPNDLVVLSDSWVKYNETDDVWEEVCPKVEDDMSEDDIRQATMDFELKMKELAKDGLAKKLKGREHFDYKPMDKAKKDQHIVDVRINGAHRRIIVVGNPRMAQALNGQLRFEGSSNPIAKLNTKIKNMMASLFTSYSPTFALRNMFRDLTHFRMMLGVREGHGYASEATKYYRKSLFKMVGLFKKYRDDSLDMSNEMERDFKDFMDNGGVTGFVFMQKVGDIQKEMEKLYKKQKDQKAIGKAIRLNDKVLDTLFGWIEAINEGVENNARFATYRASRHYAGRTKARAAYDAKEITVNFNRKGAGSKTSGFKSQNKFVEDAAKTFGLTSQVLGEGKIFFNATVQAIATTFKCFRNADGSLNKGYISKWAARYALPPFMFGLLLPFINKMLANALGSGDGDDDPYANLAEWTRRKNICLYIGNNNFITIPIGQELAAFLTLGDIFAGLTYADNIRPLDRGFDDEMLGVLNTFSPIDVDTKITKGGFSEPFSEVVGRTVSVLAPIVAVEQNLGWTGRPIYREDVYPNDKYSPEYQMVYSSTNPVLVGASKIVNDLSGGDEVARGSVQINPGIVQYLWEQYTGGPGKVFSNTISIGKDLKDIVAGNESNFNVRKVEGLKAFVQQGDDRTAYYRTMAKYRKYKADADELNDKYNGYKKLAAEDPIAFMKMDAIEKGADFERMQIIKKMDKHLNRLNKDAINAEGSERKKLRQDYNDMLKQVVNELDNVSDYE